MSAAEVVGKGVQKEYDIIKGLVFRKQMQQMQSQKVAVKNPESLKFSNEEMKAERRSQLKQNMKIWHAVCKYIHIQTEKDKIVDSMYFGSFFKASLLNKQQNGYAYCCGPKTLFKLVENQENVIEVPQQMLNERLTVLSVSTVASSAETSSEIVQKFLSNFRDEIVDSVVLRKLDVHLDFGIGTLSLFRQS